MSLHQNTVKSCKYNSKHLWKTLQLRETAVRYLISNKSLEVYSQWKERKFSLIETSTGEICTVRQQQLRADRCEVERRRFQCKSSLYSAGSVQWENKEQLYLLSSDVSRPSSSPRGSWICALVPKAALIHSVHQLSAPSRARDKFNRTVHHTTGKNFQNKIHDDDHVSINKQY